jgi:hypothetical protein
MSKAAIPTVFTGNPALDRTLQAIKQNMDQISGQTKGQQTLAPLGSAATTAQIVERLNAITERIQ